MKKEQIIIEALNQMFPDANVELHHKNHFELLIAVVLSAQTTDIGVNKVTPLLFKTYPTPKELAEANLIDVEKLIQTIGLYHNKAKNIISLSQELMNNHNGEVPNKREDLEKLPGVGRKTANVVLSNAFGVPAFAVDTHVSRVSIRLRLAKPGDDVLTIENKLNRKFPKDSWQKLHHQFIFFGRYHCLAKQPKCSNCPLFDICRYEQKKR